VYLGGLWSDSDACGLAADRRRHSITRGLNKNSSAKFGDVWFATPRPARLEGSSPNRDSSIPVLVDI
jgi:hypothetical protein